MPEQSRSGLRRLLSPETLVVVGGEDAEVAAVQTQRIGFSGRVWAVHPTRASLAGIPCVRRVADLPEPPDAALVSVSRENTVSVVAELARIGAGGAVCHASGFAEDGAYGAELQQALVEAAGDMALIGPNCLGLLNYLDGSALWPDQHGGSRVDRGVALIAQSGNIAQNLTMQRRALPLAQVVAIGNAAVTGVVDLMEAMLDDSRISAIGLYLETVPEVSALSRVALEALRRGVPIVALTSGSSTLGASVTESHTSALAGSDVLVDALFRRLGIARVHRLDVLLETLKLLHVHGALAGGRIASASCSGGEAALIADQAPAYGLTIPEFPAPVSVELSAVLGERVTIRNPLDYHTFVWGDYDALVACFTAVLSAQLDAHLLVLDLPRPDRCDGSLFTTTLAAFEAAHQATGSAACVVSALQEGMPEEIGKRLVAAGIAPLQGLSDALAALGAAAEIGAARRLVGDAVPLPPVVSPASSIVRKLDEAAAKQALRTHGLAVPHGVVTTAGAAPDVAVGLGFPVVVKGLSASVAHKSDVGLVQVGLGTRDAVSRAVATMPGSSAFLVEAMIPDAVLELVVGVRRDPMFGPVLTVGAGGLLTELAGDASTVLLPATRSDLHAALRMLRCWPAVVGYRGRRGDVDAVLDAIECIAAYALQTPDVLEVEVNPLLVLAGGAVAVDALVRLSGPERRAVDVRGSDRLAESHG